MGSCILNFAFVFFSSSRNHHDRLGISVRLARSNIYTVPGSSRNTTVSWTANPTNWTIHTASCTFTSEIEVRRFRVYFVERAHVYATSDDSERDRIPWLLWVCILAISAISLPQYHSILCASLIRLVVLLTFVSSVCRKKGKNRLGFRCRHRA